MPNHFICNSVSEEEFARLREIYEPWKDKVKYFLCGHVHSRFEDVVDGIYLIWTGGGGALIEDVSEDIRACDVEHHMVHFYLEEGILSYRFDNLDENSFGRERKNPMLKENLEKTVAASDMDHFEKDTIYVCPICGYVMVWEFIPERCPVCGGPKRQYEVFCAE